MDVIDLLTIVGRIPPQVWDAVEPHGPTFRPDRVSLVALNPQPLPPEPPPDQFMIEAGRMAKHYVRLAVDAEVHGQEPQAWLPELIRDWCINGWPLKVPKPPKPGQGPVPDPWIVGAGQVVAAVVLASSASRLQGGELRAQLAEGARELAEAALQR